MKIKSHQDFPRERLLFIKKTLEKSSILKFLAVEIESISPGFARIRIPFRSDFLQSFGVVQGGIIAMAGDTAAGIAFLTLIKENEILFTVELKINFLVSIKKEDIFAECRIIHNGKLISLGEIEVKTAMGVLVAKGLATIISRSKKK
jgi:uncharacterized protein (TIGR00369 family)